MTLLPAALPTTRTSSSVSLTSTSRALPPPASCLWGPLTWRLMTMSRRSRGPAAAARPHAIPGCRGPAPEPLLSLLRWLLMLPLLPEIRCPSPRLLSLLLVSSSRPAAAAMLSNAAMPLSWQMSFLYLRAVSRAASEDHSPRCGREQNFDTNGRNARSAPACGRQVGSKVCSSCAKRTSRGAMEPWTSKRKGALPKLKLNSHGASIPTQGKSGMLAGMSSSTMKEMPMNSPFSVKKMPRPLSSMRSPCKTHGTFNPYVGSRCGGGKTSRSSSRCPGSGGESCMMPHPTTSPLPKVTLRDAVGGAPCRYNGGRRPFRRISPADAQANEVP
mmetsp:Transcript_121379/g.338169  ORF Transcript_121379/g.338169 Transcript_121379/m.338169 type:complete len:329 (+) Transcript_121379:255-1241(+)